MTPPAQPSLTPAQRRALTRAVRNGGTIEKGGLDGDTVRQDVIERLYIAGFLALSTGGSMFADVWRVTDAGRDALAAIDPTFRPSGA